ncbi:MAG: HAD family hydrolase [Chloroflexota bacterium]
MNPNIKVILFDLGKTLMYSLHPWPEIFKLANKKLRNVIIEAVGTPNLNFTEDDFQTFFNNYFDQRNINLVELGAQKVLKDFLALKGYKDIPESIIRQALDAMYAITQINWVLEDDTIPVLDELTKKGYHLGLISNAADDRDVQQLIDRMGLRSRFEFVLTSAACGRRKPDPLMFLKALNHFSVEPHQTAMVGDTLSADISGAENLGLYSIWITRRIQLPPDGELPIQPQAIISHLTDLVPLFDDLRSKP